MVKLDRGDKILIFIISVMFSSLLFASILKQEKIRKANVEIETKDYIFNSYKETIKINPNSLCISFYDIVREYNVEHCGEFTVKYIK
jgi:hypothetical protein